MKKALITGTTGFAGSFLAEKLLSNGHFSVSGTYISENQFENINSFKKDLDLHKVNLLDEKETDDLIKETKPDLIFHLAALSFPYGSLENPAGTISNNTIAQINLFEAIRKNDTNPKVLVISSADIYGMVKEENLPIDEKTPFMPTTPYSVSKIAQDFLGLQYFLAYDMQIVRLRPFNHIGPRQAPQFVVPAFAKQIAEIEKGEKEAVIKVGNLSAKRDFTDVRDIVEAYVLALEKGDLGEVYNIGSGKSWEISEILDKLLSLSDKKIAIEIDKDKVRPKDEPDLICNHSKFTDRTGWKPKINIDQTLKDTLDYWRNIV